MHADHDARVLRISVTELCQADLPSLRRTGDLRSLWLGQALHARYQQRAALRNAGFQAEVAVHGSLQHLREQLQRQPPVAWQVEIHGRVDALWSSQPGEKRGPQQSLRIEELKSGRPPPPGPPKEAFALQAALYAWMLERERGLPVSAEIVFLAPDASAALRVPVSWPLRRLLAVLHTRIDLLLREHEADSARRAAARASADQVRFPHPHRRPGQARLEAAVETALARGEQLLLEAPTGTGKTAAVLTPALRHALAEGRHLFVLTASTLQQHLMMKTLRALAPPGLAATAVRLRARAGMCPPGHLRCHVSCCERLAAHGARSARAGLPAATFRAGPVLEPEALWRSAEAAGICPFEASLEAACFASVTVGDYNYAFDPGVTLTELRDPAALREAILVIDEVHNLPERARQALSVHLDARSLREAIEAAALGSTPIHRAQREALEAVDAFLVEIAREAGLDARREGLVEHVPDFARVEALGDALDGVVGDTLRWLGDTPGSEAQERFLAVAFAWRRLRHSLALADPGFVSLIEMQAGVPRLELFCRDPSRSLRRTLGRCHAFVGLSATLPPPAYLAEVLGLDAVRLAHERVPSPFGAHQRRLVIDPSVDTRLGCREREAPRIAARLASLAEAVPGNTLALLPSHAFLECIRQALPPLRRYVMAQSRDMPEAERAHIVEELGSHRDRLVLAIAGGALAEGVDYADGRLAAVALVGPCLPAPEPRRRLVEEWLEERCGAGFHYAYAVPGMTRVVQSAGRLIRSGEDRGVVALLGRRFLREPYRSLIPDDWLAGRPAEDYVGTPARSAADYFAGVSSGASATTT